MCFDKMKVNSGENWYGSIYKMDIYKHLKAVERERKAFHHQSPQISERSRLVSKLKQWAADKDTEFCEITLHLAVFLLDFFMDSHSIKPDKLDFIACICLVLAGKFEEQENKIPKISKINKMLGCYYVQKDVIYLERKILSYFNWKLVMPTAVHFAEYFLNYAIFPQDFCVTCTTYDYVRASMKNKVHNFLDLSLEDTLFISYTPSLVASSCILAARISFSLRPTWPNLLQEVTSYTEHDLKICTIRLLMECKKDECVNLKKRKLDLSPDQGYETEKSSCVTPKTKKD